MCASSGSGMIAALSALESKGRDEVTQVKVDNLIVINIDGNDQEGRGRDRNNDNGRKKNGDNNGQARAGANDDAARKKEEAAVAQQLMLLQVNEALLRDQQANAAQKELDNVLRAAAVSQREQEKSTVILVVQEVKVSVEVEVQKDNERKEKQKIEAKVFKQEAIVANRGKRETQTVMGKEFIWRGRTETNRNTSLRPSHPDCHRCCQSRGDRCSKRHPTCQGRSFEDG